MPKVGRNDPCPCGSGKKYKHCHLPIEEAAQAARRRLRQAVDTLVPQILTVAQTQTDTMPAAFERFWDGKYQLDQLDELDDLEGSGAQRFMTWFAFDYQLDDGRTLVERLAADGDDALDLSDEEARLLKSWTGVRLRPYVATRVLKGQSIWSQDLFDGTEIELEDHAGSRHVLVDEVMVAHLVPSGERYYIAGAAAHLTEDTREKLREFAGLHLEAFQRDHPEATWIDLLRARSEVLNHFVMQLPVEEPDPPLLERIIQQTRLTLQLTGDSLGIGKKQADEEPGDQAVEEGPDADDQETR